MLAPFPKDGSNPLVHHLEDGETKYGPSMQYQRFIHPRERNGILDALQHGGTLKTCGGKKKARNKDLILYDTFK